MPAFKWGLIGYGDVAHKRVAAALREAAGSELQAIFGRNIERSRAFASAHGIPAAHNTLDAFLSAGLEGVYVCTPPASHAEYALAAMQAGHHVLVEKPMAGSVAECERMVEAAAKHRVTLGVAYYRRAHAKNKRVRDLIASGVLGIPTWVNIAYHGWFAPEPSDPKRWRVQPAASGGAGALADIGVHRLDLLDYWLGPARLEYADMQRLVQTYEVEDGASIILKLAGGAPVHGYFAWNSRTFLDRFEMVGSEGKLLLDPLDGLSFVVLRGREREEIRFEPPVNAHLDCVADFIAAVRRSHEPLCSGEAGLRTSRLLSAIVEGRTG